MRVVEDAAVATICSMRSGGDECRFTDEDNEGVIAGRIGPYVEDIVAFGM